MAKAGQDWTARLPGGEEERKEKKEKKEKEKKEKEKKEKEKKEAGQDWTARLPEAGWRATRPCRSPSNTNEGLYSYLCVFGTSLSSSFFLFPISVNLRVSNSERPSVSDSSRIFGPQIQDSDETWWKFMIAVSSIDSRGSGTCLSSSFFLFLPSSSFLEVVVDTHKYI